MEKLVSDNLESPEIHCYMVVAWLLENRKKPTKGEKLLKLNKLMRGATFVSAGLFLTAVTVFTEKY